MALDYKDEGLTPTLRSENALTEKGDSLTSSLNFDSTYERGVINTTQIRDAAIKTAKIGAAQITTALIANAAITNAKINDFNFNQGTGGTLTLGGTLNGNGLMSVLNNTGGTVVSLSSSGITVTNGSITIQNSSGSNVIDANGLVSTTNFVSNSVTGNLLATTGTGYSDVVGGSVSIVLTRNTKVFFTYSSSMNNVGVASGYTNTLSLNVGGTDEAGPVVVGAGHDSGTGGILAYTQGASSIQTLGSGTTVVKLIGKTSNAGGEARFNQPTLSYMVLGN